MGLDTSVALQIYNKREKTEFAEIDIAYWRKHWGLDNTLRYIARTSEFWLGKDNGEAGEEFATTCSPDILNSWIDFIISALKDIEADEWSNCLWPAIEAREYTCSQLARLLSAETIVNLGFTEYSLELYNDQAETSAIQDYKDAEAYKLKTEEIKKILDSPEDYEWRVIFVSSY